MGVHPTQSILESTPTLVEILFIKVYYLSRILVDGRRLCLNANNTKEFTNKSLPLDNAWHSCMYSRALILGLVLEVRREEKVFSLFKNVINCMYALLEDPIPKY